MKTASCTIPGRGSCPNPRSTAGRQGPGRCRSPSQHTNPQGLPAPRHHTGGDGGPTGSPSPQAPPPLQFWRAASSSRPSGRPFLSRRPAPPPVPQQRAPPRRGPGPATCPGSSFRRLVAAALPSAGSDMAAATAFSFFSSFSSSVLRPGLAPLRRWRALSRPAPRAAYGTSSSPRSAARYATPHRWGFLHPHSFPPPLPPPGAAGSLVENGGTRAAAARALACPPAARRLTVALEGSRARGGQSGRPTA